MSEAPQCSRPAPGKNISIKEKFRNMITSSKIIILLIISTLIVVAFTLIIYFSLRGVRLGNRKTKTYGSLPFPDIEGPFWKSLGQRIKNSSRADRFSCCACSVILLIAIAVIIYLLAFSPSEGPSIFDISPQAWMIPRALWRGADMENDPVKYRPLRLVIVDHSATPDCESFARCAESMRNLQNYFLYNKGLDLPYNFVIGNDGMVYEARGWGLEGALSSGINTCTLGIGFIGDYRPGYGNTVLTALQVERFEKLMEYGVRKGHLDPDYVVVGVSDLQKSTSPGDNLLKQMKTWKHYDKDRYYNMTCAQIYFQDQTT